MDKREEVNKFIIDEIRRLTRDRMPEGTENLRVFRDKVLRGTAVIKCATHNSGFDIGELRSKAYTAWVTPTLNDEIDGTMHVVLLLMTTAVTIKDNSGGEIDYASDENIQFYRDIIIKLRDAMLSVIDEKIKQEEKVDNSGA